LESVAFEFKFFLPLGWLLFLYRGDWVDDLKVI